MSKVTKKSTPKKETIVGMKKKATAKIEVGKKKVVEKLPPGYTHTDSGIAIPKNLYHPVPTSKLKNGIMKAKSEIKSLINEIASTMVESYSISEIELTASFSADGKFMGFGVGGAASIKIKIKPEGH